MSDNTKTTEQLIQEYEQTETDVTTAQENLTQAQQSRDDKKAEIEAKLEELKEKFAGIGEKVEETVEETVEKVEEAVDEKLDQAKDSWAELAQTDPDKARRQLRLFWGVAGLVVGAAGAFILQLIF